MSIIDVRTAVERRDRALEQRDRAVAEVAALQAQIAVEQQRLGELKKTVRTYTTRRDALERQVQDATNRLDSLRQEIDGISEEAHRERMIALTYERYPMGATP